MTQLLPAPLRHAPLRVGLDRSLSAMVALLVLSAAPLAAQRERLTVRAERFGGTELTLPTGTVARDQFMQESMQINLGHRFVRHQSNTIVIVGGQWRDVRVALPRQQLPPAGANATTPLSTLHLITADLMLLRTVGSRHTVVGALRPGMYGDGFRVEGAAFVDRIVTSRTTIGAGLSYASTFGKLLPIPVVHVVSRPSRRLLVDALLPARADLWWMPRKGLDLGLNASLAGAQYRLQAAQRVAQGNDLWLANATMGPQVRWAPGGSKWQLTGDAGFTVVRRLEYARNGRSVADLAPGNVPFARLGLQRLF